MTTSNAIDLTALLDALRDWLPGNLDEFPTNGGTVDDVERSPDGGGETRVTELARSPFSAAPSGTSATSVSEEAACPTVHPRQLPRADLLVQLRVSPSGF